MKVTFNKNELTSALDRVQRAAQTKINSNTNNGFFISAANGIVEFQANDYTIGIKNDLQRRHFLKTALQSLLRPSCRVHFA